MFRFDLYGTDRLYSIASLFDCARSKSSNLAMLLIQRHSYMFWLRTREVLQTSLALSNFLLKAIYFIIFFAFFNISERRSDKARFYNLSHVKKGRKWLKVNSGVFVKYLS